VLAWRRDKVPGSLSRSDAVYEPPQLQPYRGRVTAYAGTMAIADAALWLMSNRRELELEITNPYELHEVQLRAALDLLREQQRFLGPTWSRPEDARAAFTRGDAVLGIIPQSIAQQLEEDRPALRLAWTLPREGSTGVADTWMLSARAKHPNCAYRWMNHVLSPQVNAEMAAFLGQAPANARACEQEVAADTCDTFKATDEDYWQRVWLHTEPQADCGDDRGRLCADAADWRRGWAEVSG
jgi:putative spermidine/putrescine transport system substrate-binding protein